MLAIIVIQLAVIVAMTAGTTAWLAGAALAMAIGSGTAAFFATIGAAIGVIAFIRS
ncbi:hypothetical protein AB0H37_00185 [Actinomadura sp. NPDC023710]|uniref:hypothetical protein n=1 Tax=Actinomadura sp. NPDC023710 TaxID=3158219 RepID=UPI0034019318